MPTIQKFEDIKAWQKARELDQQVHELISKNSGLKHDRNLSAQLDRAAGSAPANIVEGFGRGGNKEFRQCLSQAKGSVAEVKGHLYRALDKNLISPEEHARIYELADHTEKLIGSFIRYLNQSELAGIKFKKRPPQ